MEQSSTASVVGNNNPPASINNTINTALINLPQAFDTLHTGNQNTWASSSHAPVRNILASTQPLNLYYRAGSTVFQLNCSLINISRNIYVNKYLLFIVAIKMWVKETHWDEGKTDITNVNGKDLFYDYHSITETDGMNSKDACTNDRATQNARSLWKSLHT